MSNPTKFLIHDKVRVRIMPDKETWHDGKVIKITESELVVMTNFNMETIDTKQCTRDKIRIRKN